LCGLKRLSPILCGLKRLSPVLILLFFVDMEGLNSALISTKIQDFSAALTSIIITSLGILAFYINTIAVIHIVSLVLNTLLINKGLVHVITATTRR